MKANRIMDAWMSDVRIEMGITEADLWRAASPDELVGLAWNLGVIGAVILSHDRKQPMDAEITREAMDMQYPKIQQERLRRTAAREGISGTQVSSYAVDRALSALKLVRAIKRQDEIDAAESAKETI